MILLMINRVTTFLRKNHQFKQYFVIKLKKSKYSRIDIGGFYNNIEKHDIIYP